MLVDRNGNHLWPTKVTKDQFSMGDGEQRGREGFSTLLR